jgi:microcystin degradation protein MlrC
MNGHEPMRIFAAGYATETNTFFPILADLQSFRDSLYAPPGTHPDTPTLCTAPLVIARQRSRAEGFTLIEGTTAFAAPAGLVQRATHEALRDTVLGELRAAMPVDGVLLCLHGAMVAVGADDTEGELVEAVRGIVGPDVPIGVGIDPHSHLTRKRVAGANVIVAFKEFPHTDFVETGARMVDLTLRAARGEIAPVLSTFDCRMIDMFMTSRQPARDFVDKMKALEGKDKVLSVSLVHGFMAGDVPEMGTQVLVVTDCAKAMGDALAERLGREVFAMRGLSRPEFLSPDAAIDQALASGRRPAVIADTWDNPGGGVAGDSTIILRRLMERGVGKAAVGSIWDPMAVRYCMLAGEGSEIALRFGAKTAPETGMPIDALVRVTKLVPNATQKFGDSLVPVGDAAAVSFAGISVILNSTRAQCFDPSLFTALGIDPLDQVLLVVKSTNHFYAAFRKLTDAIIYCEAGHPYPNNPKLTEYRKARRNIWPRVEDPFAAEG